MAGLARKKLKTEGKNSKLKEKTQNSRKKLSFPAFPKTMNGRKVHKQKACGRQGYLETPNASVSVTAKQQRHTNIYTYQTEDKIVVKILNANIVYIFDD